ncbi:hypothetical protein, partial [Burkholderia ambifaria]|uniref:hypothetical protein n=1 Tax=Burkholderia ambifaria TaxID=152480 RepID=UPI001ABBAA88
MPSAQLVDVLKELGEEVSRIIIEESVSRFDATPEMFPRIIGDLSVISWARHIMRCKGHGYANEEETANCSASGSGP